MNGWGWGWGTEDITCSVPEMLQEEIRFLNLFPVLNGIALREAALTPVLLPLSLPMEVVAEPSAPPPQLESQYDMWLSTGGLSREGLGSFEVAEFLSPPVSPRRDSV